MPDAISEPMGCYCMDFLWNRGDAIGDATDPRTNRKIEFKATSRFEGDLSSFGPKCSFDDLIFLRYNLDTNMLYIYDLQINSADFSNYPVNSTQTISEQQAQTRRPHISLQKLFVERNNLLPDKIFDIRRIRIYEKYSREYNQIVNQNTNTTEEETTNNATEAQGVFDFLLHYNE